MDDEAENAAHAAANDDADDVLATGGREGGTPDGVLKMTLRGGASPFDSRLSRAGQSRLGCAIRCCRPTRVVNADFRWGHITLVSSTTDIETSRRERKIRGADDAGVERRMSAATQSHLEHQHRSQIFGECEIINDLNSGEN
jgi:hypothetical protein